MGALADLGILQELHKTGILGTFIQNLWHSWISEFQHLESWEITMFSSETCMNCALWEMMMQHNRKLELTGNCCLLTEGRRVITAQSERITHYGVNADGKLCPQDQDGLLPFSVEKITNRTSEHVFKSTEMMC